MKLTERLLNGILALGLALPLLAHAAGDWAHSTKIRLDTTPSGAKTEAAVAQLPLLVRLHTGNFTFSEAKPDGSDLRFFAADDKTELKYFIERYDSANELAFVWVQVPRLSPNAKSDAIWMHWGNTSAASTGDSKLVFDASQIFALNFSQTDAFKDETVNANKVTSSAKPVAFGPVGQGAGFDGAARVSLSASSSLKVTAAEGWTFSAWIKPNAADRGQLFSLGGKALSVELSGGKLQVQSGGKSAAAGTALKPGAWQHVAVTMAAGKVQFFLDGASAGDASLAGGDADGEAIVGQGFSGEMDSVLFSRTARSADYIKALSSSQSADTPMLVFGEEQEGDGINYFAILLGAVTIDGWVVIGILGVMALVSWWVMYDKTVKLGRAEKGNISFLSKFKEQTELLLDPKHAEVKGLVDRKDFKYAVLYHLYQVGMSEIEHRFDAQDRLGQPKRLSAAALESIRAAMDAFIVRNNQRLNKGIVLLTIAISGGPFLGLLGTVVGVMITFAAIAAAGDVNVNAIAPGIAAALVATVAGLAVAIPALFAYNWFAIKIKNISSDTQVFADEFLTRSAELYSD